MTVATWFIRFIYYHRIVIELMVRRFALHHQFLTGKEVASKI